jgi:hypothetical protein
MKLKIAVAFVVLVYASAVRADSIVNVQGSGLTFIGGSTLDIAMQLDLTAGTVLSYSAEFIDPENDVTNLTLASSLISPTSASFLLEGTGLLMNFGDFDYSELFYQPQVFPLPGIYTPTLFYVDTCELPEENACGVRPVDGSVIVTDPPAVGTPEPSPLLLSAMGIALLIGLARRYPHEKLGPR